MTMVLLDELGARALTDRIRSTVECVWELLYEAYTCEAWRALGYSSWATYAAVEFNLSRSYAYRLIDQGRVIRALEEAAGVSPIGDTVDINEHEARLIKPRLDELVDQVREVVAAGGDGAHAIRAAVDAAKHDAVASRLRRDVDYDDPADADAEAEAIAATAPNLFDGIDDAITSRETPTPPVSKPDLGGGVSHPARYSDALLPVFQELLHTFGHRIVTVLDPFAGTGRIHELRPAFDTLGVELEPEWANLSPHTEVGNALELRFPDETFDAVVTSPTYGNRLADHHQAADPHLRRSYTHDLGRDLSDENSGILQWGDAYRDFHAAAWCEATRVLKPGGVFVLNIKDHIRNDKHVDVAAWHVNELAGRGLTIVAIRVVPTAALRQGTNADRRSPAELVVAFEKDYQ